MTEGWRCGIENNEDGVTPDRSLDPRLNRLANLFKKHPVFLKIALLPELLATADYLLNGEIKIGACDFREPMAGSGKQTPHIDWFPRTSEQDFFDNAVAAISLDPADAKNGVFRIILGSHKQLDWPNEHWDCSVETLIKFNRN